MFILGEQQSAPPVKTSSKVLLIFLLFTISCSSGEGLRELISGKWSIEKVYENTIDVTDEHNPKGNRWIKFKEDGSFESGGDPYGDNAGKYEVLVDKSILMIYSKEENDDSEWHLTINGNNMTWKGIGTPRKEGFKLIYKKIDY